MGHVVRWKPVGDSWLKVCVHNSLPLTNREHELSVAQDARCRESIRRTLRSLAGSANMSLSLLEDLSRSDLLEILALPSEHQVGLMDSCQTCPEVAAVRGFDVVGGQVSLEDPMLFVSWLMTNLRAVETKNVLTEADVSSRIHRFQQLFLPRREGDNHNTLCTAVGFIPGRWNTRGESTVACDALRWSTEVWDFSCRSPPLLHLDHSPSAIIGDLHSYSHDNMDLLVISVFFKHKRTGFYVEVGAMDGVAASHTLALDRCLGWQGLLVEASRCAECGLKQNRPDALVEAAAVCGASRPGGGWMSVADDGEVAPFCTPFLGWSVADSSRSPCLKESQVDRRRCTTLAEIFRKHAIDRVDWLVIDVESSSLFALESIDYRCEIE